ncbi:trifunctional dihydropteroate synthetase [Ceratobasidium sp. 414]|nr:trifunctional dihydropteroate synthetase [Ceratobasidium sp. 414]
MDYSTRSKFDLIIVDGLSVHTALGASHWPRPGVEQQPQPLVLSITIPHDLAQASAGDNLEESVSYGSICKVAEACAHEKGKFSSVETLAAGIASSCFSKFSSVHEVRSIIEKQRALLHAQGAGVQSVHRRAGDPTNDIYFVRDLELSTIIGLHPWERVEKQLVRINLQWTLAPNSPALPITGFDFRSLVSRVSDLTIASSYQTVESLATSIAQTSLEAGQNIDEITVRVGKPSALMMANTAAVQITRSWTDFPELARNSLSRGLAFVPPAEGHVAILALGSNIGDRFGHIEKALKMLESEGVKVLDTSFLYETKAMYHEDQDPFVNGACAIHTPLSPVDLLALLKRVEEQVGRTPTFRNGPRVVDLDIIFYDDLTVDITDGNLPLQIPHVRLREREFVLRPLADIIPTYTHPALKIPVQTLLASLPKQPTPMGRVMPLFPTHLPPNSSSSSSRPYWTWGTQTLVMATLNTTPDSFSDGGDHNQLSSALSYVHRSLASGARVIDVGGYSTRPRAEVVGVEEEIKRIVPIIKALREEGVVVSVDTFRGSVAREAILAGASWINDVRAGRGEYLSSSSPRDGPTTLDVSREFGCPIVLMHSREAAHEDKEYPEGVLEGVRRELGACVEEALKSGVRRWNIIVDPGYGFSKTVKGNVELVRNLKHLTSTKDVLRNLPILAGTSRKSYLGAIVGGKAGEDAKERDWATAAALGACVQAGADIVRVHNVEAMKDVVVVADRIWRDGE